MNGALNDPDRLSQWPLCSAHDDANFQGAIMVTAKYAVQWNLTSAIRQWSTAVGIRSLPGI
jgi:hypothetical protein